jgi:ATPase subunit of ABC transporter with duplicated ATPase domains
MSVAGRGGLTAAWSATPSGSSTEAPPDPEPDLGVPDARKASVRPHSFAVVPEPAVLSIANLTMQFGAKPLFENVSVKLGKGNRYGLIGANGSGKSTLMRIMGGDLAPSAGSVSIDRHARIGKLRQDQFAFESHTVLDTVIMGHAELWEMKRERERIYALPRMSEDDGMKVAELEVAFGELDGYSAQARAGELLLGVDITTELHEEPMSAVAPGLKLRVLLAQALFSMPDILLLDEPTNNLDINTIRWLEGVLNAYESTMVIISHDRHFLNSVCTHVADLDFGELRVYPGNYDAYMTASTQARETLLTANARKRAEIADLRAFVSRFSANASKARQATSRQRRIEKIELEEVKASSRMSPFIRFEQDKKLHRTVLEVESLAQGHDGVALFSGLALMAMAGERIAVIGPNGIGKTTLLETLVGRMTPMRGRVKWSENANIGYFAQDHAELFDCDLGIFEWLSQWRQPGDDEQALRAVLGRLLFSRDQFDQPVRAASGGEQGRLLFARLMLQRPNVLVMDEPSNHLDMESIESLNLALEHYPGTLVLVSHDRQLVSSLATRIIELTPDGIVDFGGDYDRYLASQGIETEGMRAIA